MIWRIASLWHITKLTDTKTFRSHPSIDQTQSVSVQAMQIDAKTLLLTCRFVILLLGKIMSDSFTRICVNNARGIIHVIGAHGSWWCMVNGRGCKGQVYLGISEGCPHILTMNKRLVKHGEKLDKTRYQQPAWDVNNTVSVMCGSFPSGYFSPHCKLEWHKCCSSACRRCRPYYCYHRLEFGINTRGCVESRVQLNTRDKSWSYVCTEIGDYQWFHAWKGAQDVAITMVVYGDSLFLVTSSWVERKSVETCMIRTSIDVATLEHNTNQSRHVLSELVVGVVWFLIRNVKVVSKDPVIFEIQKGFWKL